MGKNACVVVRDEEKTYIKWMQDEDKTACTLINSFVSEVAKHIYLIRNYHTNYYARNWQTARYLMNVALPVFVDKIGGRPDAGFDNESTKYITELRTKLIEKNSGNGLNRIVDADSSEELNSKVGAVNINIDQIKNIFNSLFTN